MKFSSGQFGSVSSGAGVAAGVGVAAGFGLITIVRSSPFDSPYSELPKCCA